ncbi:Gfo/Idh/MocA family oxidoreductase [Streptomyces sp. NPDC002490]|uniref:Gfo/Idh/MocA family protein n=1 Tax=Streptomyces sp. NPDC002490 TaxID=3154416 RepID=UPI0033346637
MTRARTATAGPGLVVGVIGAGAMARTHLPAWLALGARVTVLSARDGAAVLADRYRAEGVTVARDLDDLLHRSTVIDVCTPTPEHRPLALAAIRAGRSVVCEKPLALTGADAAEIARAAEEAGVLLFPAHVVRYFPAYAALAGAVARGELGPPSALRFTRSGAHPGRASWFADPASSGGVLMDFMIHDMDCARWVAGEVVRVRAGVRSRPPGAGGTPLVQGAAVLTHASGAVSRVYGTWGRGDLPFRTTFRVTGPGGVREHDSAAGGQPAPGPADGPYLAQLRDFTTALAGGPPPRVSPGDGVAAVRIAAAAVLSSRTGESVDLVDGHPVARGGGVRPTG